MIPIALPDLLDNSTPERSMSANLSALLPGTAASFATCYFNLAGFTSIADGLQTAHAVRVLLGQEPVVGVHNLMSPELVQRVLEDTTGDLSDLLKMGHPQGVLDAARLLAFLKRPEVEFRLFTSRFFHAKAYVLEHVPMFDLVAIVGSSNLTGAGLTGNTELNMVQKQRAVAAEYLDWFNRFWNDPGSVDFKPQLVDLYTTATKLHAPYLVYMKSLLESLGERLAVDGSGTGTAGSPGVELADFQERGYWVAKDILETYGGVLVGDPVGLGKTYIALKLLDDYAYRMRQRALIICPAQLRDTVWRNALEAFSIQARIETMERLGQGDFLVSEVADSDLVVIDESHNFRNPTTARYDTLSRILTTGKPKKLILLTATPINNSVFDLKAQVELITSNREDYFSRVGIPNLTSYFKSAKRDGVGLHDLLETIAVRRSRAFIERNYPAATINGKEVKFPKRELHTINYDLQGVYSGLYDDLVRMIQNLRFAPYMLDFYRHDVPPRLRQALAGDRMPDFATVSPDDALVLGRQMALAGLMQILYLKRLESSVEALRHTLVRVLRFQKAFLEQLRAGRLLNSKAFSKISGLERLARGQDGDDELGTPSEDVDQEVEALLATLEPIDTALYDVEAVSRAVEYDVSELAGIVERLEAIRDSDDDKLATLLETLRGPLAGRKVLLFSTFKHTVDYLAQALRRDSDLSDRLIGVASGALGPADRRTLIKRFSPRSNRVVGADPGRADTILLSTDVLAEGQNLQDASVVLNYDLAWNPIRMVQRAGRIDRLGTEHATISIHNFIPEAALDSLLNLMTRLRERLETIDRSGFLDASVLGEAPGPLDFNAIRDIAAERSDIYLDLLAVAELDTGEQFRQELLDYLTRKKRSDLDSLLPAAGSGRRGPQGRRGLYLHLRAGSQHFQLFYDLASKKWCHDKLEALSLVRCAEREPLVEPDFDVFPIIASGKAYVGDFFRRNSVRGVKLQSPQNHVVNWIRSIEGDTRFAEAAVLRSYFRDPLPSRHLKRLRKEWSTAAEPERQRFDRLLRFVEDNPITVTQKQEGQIILEDDLDVVCYIAMV